MKSMLYGKDEFAAFLATTRDSAHQNPDRADEGVFLTGLLDPRTSDAHLAYSPTLDPQHWTSIPQSLVETVEVIGNVTVHGVRLFLVEIHLIAPSTELELFLVELLRSCTGPFRGSTPAPTPPTRPLEASPDSAARRTELSMLGSGWPPKITLPDWLNPGHAGPIIPPIAGLPWDPWRISRYSKCAKCQFWIKSVLTAATVGASTLAQITEELEQQLTKELAERVAQGYLQGLGVDALIKQACVESGPCK